MPNAIDRPKHPTRVGPYRIEDRIGVGGMGAVYRAWDERLKRPVAIKHFLPEFDDPELRERFRREAQASASLNHTAIVHIYDIVEDDKGDWIVMELVEGKRLDRLLRRGRLGLPRALRLARQLARGLAEAHSKGIIHRDLKAENVMVTAGPQAKILDFGLAKFSAELRDSDASTTTTQGAVLGTARAMSPEQAMGLGVDARSDLFSLGTLFYEMFTGISPFKSEAVVETLKRVCTLRQTPAHVVSPEVPRELSVLIDRLLEKNPEARPRNAREVASVLAKVAVDEEETATDPGTDTADLDLSDDSGPASSPAFDSEDPDASSDDDSQDSTTVPHRPLAALPGNPISFRSPGRAPIAAPPPPSPLPAALSPTQALATAHFPMGFRQLGERRQVTVLCGDLVAVGAEGCDELGPEALYEVMLVFRTVAGETIERFEGHLGKILGHRLWAYFGFPRAHEDAAVRAVRAALELVERARRLAAPPGPELAFRAGIHSGLAVVPPAFSSEDEIALGSTFERALAIHARAAPHGVVVSGDTHRLVAASFSTEAAPASSSPGAWRILAPRKLGNREERPTALVGREREMEILSNLWSAARRGEGRAVLLAGEAGIGKSRLVCALKERLEAETPQWWTARGSPFARESPYHPVADLLRGLLGSDAPTLEQLETAVEGHALAPAVLVPVLASLLGVPFAGRHPLPSSPAAKRRSTTQDALRTFFLEQAARRPAVMAVEDLQWVDPSTLEMLDRLLAEVREAPLLLVLTFRPDFEPPWGPRQGLTQLELEPLAEPEAARLAEQTAGERKLLAAVRDTIVDLSDGVPLFVVELARAPYETGEELPVPATLRDPLSARLDALGTAKALAQQASVIGRAFDRRQLAAVTSFDGEVLQREIERLLRARILVRVSSKPPERYRFHRALVRKSAYESLLATERRRLHRALDSFAADSGS